MMPVGNLAKMVVANTSRSPRHCVLSAFGISTFVLFLASTEQVSAVLEKIFPVEQVQVVAPRAVLGTIDVSKKLDDSIVEKIKARPEVARAVPRMALTFPAFGRGDFEGNDLRFEVGGFADGVDSSFVTDDPRIRSLFKDWTADPNDPNRVACTPPPRGDHDEVIQSPRARPDPNAKKQKLGWGDEVLPPVGGDQGPPEPPVGGDQGPPAPTPAPPAGSANLGSAVGS